MVLDPALVVRRQTELDELVAVVAPVVAADGGELHVEAVDLVAGVVAVSLSGACSACAVSQVTLEAGIERILRQRLDWVTEVRKAVADSADLDADAALGRGGFVRRWTRSDGAGSPDGA